MTFSLEKKHTSMVREYIKSCMLKRLNTHMIRHKQGLVELGVTGSVFKSFYNELHVFKCE